MDIYNQNLLVDVIRFFIDIENKFYADRLIEEPIDLKKYLEDPEMNLDTCLGLVKKVVESSPEINSVDYLYSTKQFVLPLYEMTGEIIVTGRYVKDMVKGLTEFRKRNLEKLI